MTTLIKQEGASDCELACMAMALGMTYDDLRARLGPGFVRLINLSGTSDFYEDVMLATLGLVEHQDYEKGLFSHHQMTMWFAKRALWGRRAILSVRSKNNVDGRHAIYWDGERIFDPSPKLTYDDWSEVEPIEWLLFRETPA